jgi:hypothetical protein
MFIEREKTTHHQIAEEDRKKELANVLQKIKSLSFSKVCENGEPVIDKLEEELKK